MASEKWLDAHGQPPRRYYQDRVEDRLVAEMLGLVKGVLADGMVNDAEAVALRQWLQSHPDVTTGYPGDVLAARLVRVFDDAMVDEDERADLTDLLQQLVGEPSSFDSMLDRATRLPVDDPLPTLLFDSWEYVFTGKFAYGARKRCCEAVVGRGGRTANTITKRTDVLVIGTFGSDAWVQSTHGNKILQAMDVRAGGAPIRIVPEEYWMFQMESC